MAKPIIIHATTLYDGLHKRSNVYLAVEGDKITEVSSKKTKADAEGIVTPAFIDAHSHIGMFRSGEPGSEAEGNDITDQFQANNDPLDSVYFDDPAFAEAVDYGVLYSCIVPGSGNLVGGRAMIIRNFAANRSQALLKEYGFKMALGYNPRSTGEWKGIRPNTRMGICSMLEKRFDLVLAKKQKGDLARQRKLKELDLKVRDKDSKLSSKDIEDDVLYLIELVKKYKLTVTADHLGDVHHREIFDQLADHNIPIVYGPLGSLPYKVELRNEHYRNAELLMKSKALYGLMTDHPVIMTPALRDSLKYFLIHGMKEEEAIGMITHKNAKILGIEDKLGSVEPGKLASLVVWDKDPLHLGAFPRLVMAEGKVVRKQK
jgi:imidazolonepropionase-like amidohydrolase